MLACQWVESDGTLDKMQMYGFIACGENCSIASDANKHVSHCLKFACAISKSRVFSFVFRHKRAEIALDSPHAMLHEESGRPHLLF